MKRTVSKRTVSPLGSLTRSFSPSFSNPLPPHNNPEGFFLIIEPVNTLHLTQSHDPQLKFD